MLGHDEQIIHNESTTGRMKRDEEDENKIVSILKRCGIFEADYSCGTLQNIVTKDLTTSDIEESLLNAEKYGQAHLTVFVKQCLMPETEDNIKFRDPLHKVRTPTFFNLYTVCREQKGREKIIKADLYILQRLITAY